MISSEPGVIAWRKSTFSGNGSACVEVGWRKSSFSASNGDCVEVGWQEASPAVRDSKDTEGPRLGFPMGEWRAFLATLGR
jgi:uncharacterized protein DUF397